MKLPTGSEPLIPEPDVEGNPFSWLPLNCLWFTDSIAASENPLRSSMVHQSEINELTRNSIWNWFLYFLCILGKWGCYRWWVIIGWRLWMIIWWFYFSIIWGLILTLKNLNSASVLSCDFLRFINVQTYPVLAADVAKTLVSTFLNTIDNLSDRKL